MNETVKRYYQLTKPGIVYGNDLSVIAGLLLASLHFHVFKPATLAMTLVGISLVMGSSCVFNNYLDRNIDAKMARTKKRALVDGTISPQSALVYGTVLGLIGFGLLALFANWLTVLLGFAGFVFYVVVYGIGKRKSIYGTEIGSISGAIPPLAGYTAISGHVDAGAVILFVLLTLWQMPHFFGIAMYRMKDYKAAGIPVLPAVKGMKRTKIEVLGYIVLFMLALPLLTLYGYTGTIFVVVMMLLAFYWFLKGLRSFNTLEDAIWGRNMFLFSLIVLLVLCAMIPLGALLP